METPRPRRHHGFAPVAHIWEDADHAWAVFFVAGKPYLKPFSKDGIEEKKERRNTTDEGHAE